MPIVPHQIGSPMYTPSAFTTLALIGLFVTACGESTQEQSPGEVLARDSLLASELKQSDTSSFADAGDVVIAFNPDSAMPPTVVEAKPRLAPLRPAPSTTRSRVDPTAAEILAKVPGAALPR